MRANFSPDLERLLRRADPLARPIVEAVVVEREDVRDRQEA